MGRITDVNGFKAKAALAKAARHKGVAEIEGGGMDEGRVFLHATDGWWFKWHCTTSKSVGSASELASAMRQLVVR